MTIKKSDVKKKNITDTITDNFLSIDKYSKYIFIIIIILHYVYWKSDIVRGDKLKGLLTFYGAITSVMSVFNIYKTAKIQYITTVNSQITYLNQLFQNITQSISSFFTNNKQMRYYYDELFNNITNTDDSIRDYNYEQIITNNILINIDSLINYIDSFKITSDTNFQIIIMERKLKNLIKSFFKSKIFYQNWLKFKTHFALQWTIDYIEMII